MSNNPEHPNPNHPFRYLPDLNAPQFNQDVQEAGPSIQQGGQSGIDHGQTYPAATNASPASNLPAQYFFRAQPQFANYESQGAAPSMTTVLQLSNRQTLEPQRAPSIQSAPPAVEDKNKGKGSSQFEDRGSPQFEEILEIPTKERLAWIYVLNRVIDCTLEFKRLEKPGFLTEIPDARGQFTYAEYIDVITALELQMMDLGAKFAGNSNFVRGTPVPGKVTEFFTNSLETEGFSHLEADEVASSSILNAAERLCTDKRQGDFIVEYTLSGYESPEKEETMYAHFSAKGLQLAGYEILRLFPPQIILHVIRDQGSKRLGILATAASLIQTALVYRAAGFRSINIIGESSFQRRFRRGLFNGRSQASLDTLKYVTEFGDETPNLNIAVEGMYRGVVIEAENALRVFRKYGDFKRHVPHYPYRHARDQSERAQAKRPPRRVITARPIRRLPRKAASTSGPQS